MECVSEHSQTSLLVKSFAYLTGRFVKMPRLTGAVLPWYVAPSSSVKLIFHVVVLVSLTTSSFSAGSQLLF